MSKYTQQSNKATRALSVIFHPIIRLLSWRDPLTKPETTVLYPHRQVELESLAIRFGSLNVGGMSTVYASYRTSDEGRVVHLRLFIKEHTSTPVGKFDRTALQVRLRDAVTDELIEILGYSTPANSPESVIGTRFIPEGMATEHLEGDLLTYGMRNNIIHWDWQHNPEATKHFGLSQCHFVEFSIKAVRLVKAEFRLVSHFQINGKATKRSIPQREGMFVEQFLELDDYEV